MYSLIDNREKIKEVIEEVRNNYDIKKKLRKVLFGDKIKLSKNIKSSIDSKYFKLNNCDGDYVNFSFNKKMRDNVNEYGEKVAIDFAINYLKEILNDYYGIEMKKKKIKIIFNFDCSKQNIIITI